MFKTIANAIKTPDVRKKLFKEIHDSLGGKLRICVAGAAAFS